MWWEKGFKGGGGEGDSAQGTGRFTNLKVLILSPSSLTRGIQAWAGLRK